MELSNLVIQNGLAPPGDSGVNGSSSGENGDSGGFGQNGGGIDNNGILTMNMVTVQKNSAGDGGDGGDGFAGSHGLGNASGDDGGDGGSGGYPGFGGGIYNSNNPDKQFTINPKPRRGMV